MRESTYFSDRTLYNYIGTFIQTMSSPTPTQLKPRKRRQVQGFDTPIPPTYYERFLLFLYIWIIWAYQAWSIRFGKSD
jgi:hypothetical protein